MFQSLFSWNLLLMCARLATFGRFRFRFNPCFRGTCSWWPKHHPRPSQRIPFQSLFSWNLLLMGTLDSAFGSPIEGFNPCFRGTCSWCILYSSHPPAKSAFQSLFSWNLLLMFIKLSKLLSDQGFNPCFRGTCSWCYFDTFLYIHLFLVSILVFVELALDARNEELTNSS